MYLMKNCIILVSACNKANETDSLNVKESEMDYA